MSVGLRVCAVMQRLAQVFLYGKVKTPAKGRTRDWPLTNAACPPWQLAQNHSESELPSAAELPPAVAFFCRFCASRRDSNRVLDENRQSDPGLLMALRARAEQLGKYTKTWPTTPKERPRTSLGRFKSRRAYLREQMRFEPRFRSRAAIGAGSFRGAQRARRAAREVCQRMA